MGRWERKRLLGGAEKDQPKQDTDEPSPEVTVAEDQNSEKSEMAVMDQNSRKVITNEH